VPDLERQKIRSKFEAFVLDASAGVTHKIHGQTKRDVIGAMRGTVVELGPGTGVNMRYYAPGVHVIGIEPNRLMHQRLRAKAAEHDVDLEIRTLRGESIDVDDESADGVIGTLVLCGVDDPRQVVNEVRRVLKPGGTYFFIEHVIAPAGSKTRTAQKVLFRPHRWLFNGCEVTRDTASVIHSIGFTDVEIGEIDTGIRSGHVRHFISGTATK
jgi:ubiquinone/menaquinone biosynthesis C-methylase UbiE